MYLRHQAYTLYYRDVCILVFLHVFAYSMLLRRMLKFKRLARGSDNATQYNTIHSYNISVMPVVEASLTRSFPYQTQYISCRKSETETIVQCFVCNLISVFRFDLLHGRNCVPNIDAKSFSLGSLSLPTNFQNFSTNWSNAVNVVLYIFIERCYACSN